MTPPADRFGRPDYNLIGTEDDPIPEEEPVFLLRAQDELAWLTVESYALYADLKGYHRVAASARKQAVLMRAWPTKKSPDL